MYSDMRQQLAGLIYKRTGIILNDGEDNAVDYMPKSMRELTQLLKNLRRFLRSKEKYCTELIGSRQKRRLRN